MNPSPINILLADDDLDDCFLFKEALAGVALPTSISMVHNGMQLMQMLGNSTIKLPDVLFLDLNMPRKNGYDCLTEIKLNSKLSGLPVIIYSTSLDPTVASLMYEKGALYYVRKPREFSSIREIIYKALTLVTQLGNTQPVKSKFVLGGQND